MIIIGAYQLLATSNQVGRRTLHVRCSMQHLVLSSGWPGHSIKGTTPNETHPWHHRGAAA